jgi:hypothetical protein
MDFCLYMERLILLNIPQILDNVQHNHFVMNKPFPATFREPTGE